MKSLGLVMLLFEIAWAVSDGRVRLSIYPLGRSIMCREHEDLNLTCKITGHEPTREKYNLSWSLPMKNHLNNRVFVYKTSSELTVSIRDVQEGDAGQYVCEVIGGGLLRRTKVAVVVKTGKEKCMKNFFLCENRMCIPQHYACDGHIDCPGGSDESVKYCGEDPCLGKFLCDGRCIPRKFCCDPIVDLNCSVNYIMPCCQRLLHHAADMDAPGLPVVQPQHNDVYFLQCTIYTIISFAAAFILITAVLAVFVCRFHSRRVTRIPYGSSRLHRHSSRRRLWPWHPSRVDTRTDPGRTAPNSPWNDDEQMSSYLQSNISRVSEANVISLDSSSGQDPLENFVLLTYGSHGFEVADRIPKPPPYTEALHHFDQPPPPYASSKNLAEDETESEHRPMANGHTTTLHKEEASDV